MTMADSSFLWLGLRWTENYGGNEPPMPLKHELAYVLFLQLLCVWTKLVGFTQASWWLVLLPVWMSGAVCLASAVLFAVLAHSGSTSD